jgi:hypothetical protein
MSSTEWSRGTLSDRDILVRIWWSVWVLGLLNLAALLAVLVVAADG